MSLEGAKFVCLDGDGNHGEVLLAKGRKFTVGYYVSCDFVLADERAKGVHCEIECDAFGRVTIRNLSPDKPILVNGSTVEIKRILLNNSKLSILDKEYLWLFPKRSSNEFEDLPINDASTPQKLIGLPEQPPSSCPDFKLHREVPKRFTVHNFAYCIQSDEEGNTSTDSNINNEEINNEQPHSKDNQNETETPNEGDNNTKNSKESKTQLEDKTNENRNRSVTPEPKNDNTKASATLLETPKMNLINCTKDKENKSTQKKNKQLLTMCHQSDVVITSYSPREAGVKIERSFASVVKPKVLVTKTPATPKSVYSTPKSDMNKNEPSEEDESELMAFHTPSTSKKSAKVHTNSSMHLIDLTTPNKLRPASPYLKSALKASAKKNIIKTADNDKSCKLSSEEQLGLSALPCTPVIAETSNSPSETPSSVISVSSSTDTSSVIEVTSDGSSIGITPVSSTGLTTPIKPQTRAGACTPKRTPQSLMKRALLTSAKKQNITPQRNVNIPTTPRRESINRIPLRSNLALLRTPTTPQASTGDKSTSQLPRRQSMSTPTRKSMPARSRFDSSPSTSNSVLGLGSSSSRVSSRRSSINPISIAKALPTSTPVSASTSNSALRTRAACKTSPLHKVRKSLGGIPLSSHISKARRSIVLPASTSKISSIRQKSPQQVISDRLVTRARKSLCVTPISARSRNMVTAAKTPPQPSSILKAKTTQSAKKPERKAVLFADKQPPLSSEVDDLSRTFIIDSDEEDEKVEQIKNQEETRKDITFSPEKDTTDKGLIVPQANIEIPVDVEEITSSNKETIEEVVDQEKTKGTSTFPESDIKKEIVNSPKKIETEKVALAEESFAEIINDSQESNEENSEENRLTETIEIPDSPKKSSQTESQESFGEAVQEIVEENNFKESENKLNETNSDNIKTLITSNEEKTEDGFGEESIVEILETSSNEIDLNEKDDEAQKNKTEINNEKLTESYTQEIEAVEITEPETTTEETESLNVKLVEDSNEIKENELKSTKYKPIVEDITLEGSIIEKDNNVSKQPLLKDITLEGSLVEENTKNEDIKDVNIKEAKESHVMELTEKIEKQEIENNSNISATQEIPTEKQTSCLDTEKDQIKDDSNISTTQVTSTQESFAATEKTEIEKTKIELDILVTNPEGVLESSNKEILSTVIPKDTADDLGNTSKLLEEIEDVLNKSDEIKQKHLLELEEGKDDIEKPLTEEFESERLSQESSLSFNVSISTNSESDKIEDVPKSTESPEITSVQVEQKEEECELQTKEYIVSQTDEITSKNNNIKSKVDEQKGHTINKTEIDETNVSVENEETDSLEDLSQAEGSISIELNEEKLDNESEISALKANELDELIQSQELEDDISSIEEICISQQEDTILIKENIEANVQEKNVEIDTKESNIDVQNDDIEYSADIPFQPDASILKEENVESSLLETSSQNEEQEIIPPEKTVVQKEDTISHKEKDTVPDEKIDKANKTENVKSSENIVLTTEENLETKETKIIEEIVDENVSTSALTQMEEIKKSNQDSTDECSLQKSEEKETEENIEKQTPVIESDDIGATSAQKQIEKSEKTNQDTNDQSTQQKSKEKEIEIISNEENIERIETNPETSKKSTLDFQEKTITSNLEKPIIPEEEPITEIKKSKELSSAIKNKIETSGSFTPRRSTRRASQSAETPQAISELTFTPRRSTRRASMSAETTSTATPTKKTTRRASLSVANETPLTPKTITKHRPSMSLDDESIKPSTSKKPRAKTPLKQLEQRMVIAEEIDEIIIEEKEEPAANVLATEQKKPEKKRRSSISKDDVVVTPTRSRSSRSRTPLKQLEQNLVVGIEAFGAAIIEEEEESAAENKNEIEAVAEEVLKEASTELKQLPIEPKQGDEENKEIISAENLKLCAKLDSESKESFIDNKKLEVEEYLENDEKGTSAVNDEVITNETDPKKRNDKEYSENIKKDNPAHAVQTVQDILKDSEHTLEFEQISKNTTKQLDNIEENIPVNDDKTISNMDSIVTDKVFDTEITSTEGSVNVFVAKADDEAEVVQSEESAIVEENLNKKKEVVQDISTDDKSSVSIVEDVEDISNKDHRDNEVHPEDNTPTLLENTPKVTEEADESGDNIEENEIVESADANRNITQQLANDSIEDEMESLAFYDDMEEPILTKELEETTEDNKQTEISSPAKKSVKILADSPKTPQMSGMRDLLKTPKSELKTPRLEGLRDLVRTPKDVIETKEQEIEKLAFVADLLKTPKAESSSSQTPKTKKQVTIAADSPKTPLMTGMRELLKTPKGEICTPKFAGIRHLIQTPKSRIESEQEETEKLAVVAELVQTPQILAKTIVEELPSSSLKNQRDNLKGVKELLKTPKSSTTPRFKGMRELMQTPKAVMTPQLGGVKELLNSPLPQETTDIDEVQNPDEIPPTNLKGVKELLKTPKSSSTPRLKGIRELMQTPKMSSTPILRGLKELMDTPAQQKDNDELDKYLRTPTAKNIMIPSMPSSAIIEKSSDSIEVSTEYDLNATNDEEAANLEDLFKTPVASRFVERITASYYGEEHDETLERFNKTSNQTQNVQGEKIQIETPIRKTNKLQSFGLQTPQPLSPFTTADVLSDLPRTEVEEWVETLNKTEASTILEGDDINNEEDVEQVDECVKAEEETEAEEEEEIMPSLEYTLGEDKQNTSLNESIIPETCAKVYLREKSLSNITTASITESQTKDPLLSTSTKPKEKEQRPITPIDAEISGINLLDQTIESIHDEPSVLDEPLVVGDEPSIFEEPLMVSDDESEAEVTLNNIDEHSQDETNDLSEPLLVSDSEDLNQSRELETKEEVKDESNIEAKQEELETSHIEVNAEEKSILAKAADETLGEDPLGTEEEELSLIVVAEEDKSLIEIQDSKVENYSNTDEVTVGKLKPTEITTGQLNEVITVINDDQQISLNKSEPANETDDSLIKDTSAAPKDVSNQENVAQRVTEISSKTEKIAETTAVKEQISTKEEKQFNEATASKEIYIEETNIKSKTSEEISADISNNDIFEETSSTNEDLAESEEIFEVKKPDSKVDVTETNQQLDHECQDIFMDSSNIDESFADEANSDVANVIENESSQKEEEISKEEFDNDIATLEKEVSKSEITEIEKSIVENEEDVTETEPESQSDNVEALYKNRDEIAESEVSVKQIVESEQTEPCLEKQNLETMEKASEADDANSDIGHIIENETPQKEKIENIRKSEIEKSIVENEEDVTETEAESHSEAFSGNVDEIAEADIAESDVSAEVSVKQIVKSNETEPSLQKQYLEEEEETIEKATEADDDEIFLVSENIDDSQIEEQDDAKNQISESDKIVETSESEKIQDVTCTKEAHNEDDIAQTLSSADDIDEDKSDNTAKVLNVLEAETSKTSFDKKELIEISETIENSSKTTEEESSGVLKDVGSRESSEEKSQDGKEEIKTETLETVENSPETTEEELSREEKSQDINESSLKLKYSELSESTEEKSETMAGTSQTVAESSLQLEDSESSETTKYKSQTERETSQTAEESSLDVINSELTETTEEKSKMVAENSETVQESILQLEDSESSKAIEDKSQTERETSQTAEESSLDVQNSELSETTEEKSEMVADNSEIFQESQTPEESPQTVEESSLEVKNSELSETIEEKSEMVADKSETVEETTLQVEDSESPETIEEKLQTAVKTSQTVEESSLEVKNSELSETIEEKSEMVADKSESVEETTLQFEDSESHETIEEKSQTTAETSQTFEESSLEVKNSELSETTEEKSEKVADNSETVQELMLHLEDSEPSKTIEVKSQTAVETSQTVEESSLEVKNSELSETTEDKSEMVADISKTIEETTLQLEDSESFETKEEKSHSPVEKLEMVKDISETVEKLTLQIEEPIEEKTIETVNESLLESSETMEKESETIESSLESTESSKEKSVTSKESSFELPETSEEKSIKLQTTMDTSQTVEDSTLEVKNSKLLEITEGKSEMIAENSQTVKESTLRLEDSESPETKEEKSHSAVDTSQTVKDSSLEVKNSELSETTEEKSEMVLDNSETVEDSALQLEDSESSETKEEKSHSAVETSQTVDSSLEVKNSELSETTEEKSETKADNSEAVEKLILQIEKPIEETTIETVNESLLESTETTEKESETIESYVESTETEKNSKNLEEPTETTEETSLELSETSEEKSEKLQTTVETSQTVEESFLEIKNSELSEPNEVKSVTIEDNSQHVDKSILQLEKTVNEPLLESYETTENESETIKSPYESTETSKEKSVIAEENSGNLEEPSLELKDIKLSESLPESSETNEKEPDMIDSSLKSTENSEGKSVIAEKNSENLEETSEHYKEDPLKELKKPEISTENFKTSEIVKSYDFEIKINDRDNEKETVTKSSDSEPEKPATSLRKRKASQSSEVVSEIPTTRRTRKKTKTDEPTNEVSGQTETESNEPPKQTKEVISSAVEAHTQQTKATNEETEKEDYKSITVRSSRKKRTASESSQDSTQGDESHTRSRRDRRKVLKTPKEEKLEKVEEEISQETKEVETKRKRTVSESSQGSVNDDDDRSSRRGRRKIQKHPVEETVLEQKEDVEQMEENIVTEGQNNEATTSSKKLIVNKPEVNTKTPTKDQKSIIIKGQTTDTGELPKVNEATEVTSILSLNEAEDTKETEEVSNKEEQQNPIDIVIENEIIDKITEIPSEKKDEETNKSDNIEISKEEKDIVPKHINFPENPPPTSMEKLQITGISKETANKESLPDTLKETIEENTDQLHKRNRRKPSISEIKRVSIDDNKAEELPIEKVSSKESSDLPENKAEVQSKLSDIIEIPEVKEEENVAEEQEVSTTTVEKHKDHISETLVVSKNLDLGRERKKPTVSESSQDLVQEDDSSHSRKIHHKIEKSPAEEIVMKKGEITSTKTIPTIQNEEQQLTEVVLKKNEPTNSNLRSEVPEIHQSQNKPSVSKLIVEHAEVPSVTLEDVKKQAATRGRRKPTVSETSQDSIHEDDIAHTRRNRRKVLKTPVENEELTLAVQLAESENVDVVEKVISTDSEKMQTTEIYTEHNEPTVSKLAVEPADVPSVTLEDIKEQTNKRSCRKPTVSESSQDSVIEDDTARTSRNRRKVRKTPAEAVVPEENEEQTSVVLPEEPTETKEVKNTVSAQSEEITADTEDVIEVIPAETSEIQSTEKVKDTISNKDETEVPENSLEQSEPNVFKSADEQNKGSSVVFEDTNQLANKKGRRKPTVSESSQDSVHEDDTTRTRRNRRKVQETPAEDVVPEENEEQSSIVPPEVLTETKEIKKAVSAQPEEITADIGDVIEVIPSEDVEDKGSNEDETKVPEILVEQSEPTVSKSADEQTEGTSVTFEDTKELENKKESSQDSVHEVDTTRTRRNRRKVQKTPAEESEELTAAVQLEEAVKDETSLETIEKTKSTELEVSQDHNSKSEKVAKTVNEVIDIAGEYPSSEDKVNEEKQEQDKNIEEATTTVAVTDEHNEQDNAKVPIKSVARRGGRRKVVSEEAEAERTAVHTTRRGARHKAVASETTTIKDSQIPHTSRNRKTPTEHVSINVQQELPSVEETEIKENAKVTAETEAVEVSTLTPVENTKNIVQNAPPAPDEKTTETSVEVTKVRSTSRNRTKPAEHFNTSHQEHLESDELFERKQAEPVIPKGRTTSRNRKAPPEPSPIQQVVEAPIEIEEIKTADIAVKEEEKQHHDELKTSEETENSAANKHEESEKGVKGRLKRTRAIGEKNQDSVPDEKPTKRRARHQMSEIVETKEEDLRSGDIKPTTENVEENSPTEIDLHKKHMEKPQKSTRRRGAAAKHEEHIEHHEEPSTKSRRRRGKHGENEDEAHVDPVVDHKKEAEKETLISEVKITEVNLEPEELVNEEQNISPPEDHQHTEDNETLATTKRRAVAKHIEDDLAGSSTLTKRRVGRRKVIMEEHITADDTPVEHVESSENTTGKRRHVGRRKQEHDKEEIHHHDEAIHSDEKKHDHDEPSSEKHDTEEAKSTRRSVGRPKQEHVEVIDKQLLEKEGNVNVPENIETNKRRHVGRKKNDAESVQESENVASVISVDIEHEPPHEEEKKGRGRKKKHDLPEVTEQPSTSHSPGTKHRGRKRKESHTDTQEHISSTKEESKESPNESTSIAAEVHTPDVVNIPGNVQKPSDIEHITAESTEADDTPGRRARNVPQRRAATAYHNYDETSDSEVSTKPKKKTDSPRKSLEVTKTSPTATVTTATITNLSPSPLSTTTARGRTRKPTAKVQQFLEEERAKAETPKKRGLLAAVTASETATPQRTPARRGRKPSTIETDVEGTPHVATKGRPRGRPAAVAPKEVEHSEISQTPAVEEVKEVEPHITPIQAHPVKARRGGRKAKMTEDEHHTSDEPPAKKSPLELESEKQDSSPAIEGAPTPPTRIAGRRNAAAAAKARIEEDALAAAAIDPPKRARARKAPPKISTPVVASTDNDAQNSSEIKEEEATTSKNSPQKREHRLASASTLEGAEDLDDHLEPETMDKPAANKRGRKAVATTASSTDSPAVPVKRSRKVKAVEEADAPDTPGESKTTRGRGRGRKNVHFDEHQEAEATALTSTTQQPPTDIEAPVVAVESTEPVKKGTRPRRK